MLSFFYVSLCCYLSYKVSHRVVKQTEIFQEYKQRRIIVFLVWLVAIGVMIAVFLPYKIGWLIPYLMSSICFLVVAFEAKFRISKFEISGTNRTVESIKTLQLATLATIVGFLYIGVQLIFILLTQGLQY